MGAYNTIMFLVLLAGTGLLWIIGLLFSAPLVDVANQLINMGMLSTYTVNAFTLVLNLLKWCPPAVVVLIVAWYISGAVGGGERV